jgi:signal transduction histidine kinase
MTEQMTSTALRRRVAQWTRAALEQAGVYDVSNDGTQIAKNTSPLDWRPDTHVGTRWRQKNWWPPHRRNGRSSQEPGAALFQGLRFRLTLWYCGVLCAALIVFSLALYLAVQHFLLAPIDDEITTHAHMRVDQWLTISPGQACSSFIPLDRFGPEQSTSEIVACFDQNGSLLQDESTALLPPAFLTNTVVKTALQEGVATDIVDIGGTVGRIYRYAQAVPGPTGNLGVVLIGMSIEHQETVLSLLLMLLLTIGGITLLGAGLGGLFLANRALVPARLAWVNQQRFIADAAHELRTPLTLLRADAEVLLRNREHLAVEDAALLEDIVAESQHMATLATSMLTLARLDNRYPHQEYEVVNLAEVALAGARRVQALADQMGISIQVENIVEKTGVPYVIGDPTLLEQAVLVLLDNAIKYNRRGGHVTVRTATRQGQALLEVSDTGIGIAEEHLPYLGERFYRVDKARSREAGGTGLGLSIARGIAIAHHATLALSSIPEQGTTATLLLPALHSIPGPMCSSS